MGTIYITIILLCRIVQHLCSKHTSNNINNLPCFFQYGAFKNLLSGAMGLILIFVGRNGFSWNTPTVFISSFSGIMLVISSGLGLLSLKSGTVALSSMFGTAGLLVPCIAGIFLFDEPMSIGQIFGMILFFISAYFLISSSAKIYNKFSLKNLLLLLGIMLSNGFTMLAQQMFTFYVPDGDVSVFSFLSFSIVGVFMLIMSYVFTIKDNGCKNCKLTPKLIGLGAALSAAVFIINQLATLATAFVPPVILFTFINGGSTIIAAIVAAVFFHEKLTTRSVAGILLGVLSMVIIKAM